MKNPDIVLTSVTNWELLTQQICIPTLCGMCLPAGRGLCGVNAFVEDEMIVKVEGRLEHPFNHGRLCSRGLASVQLVNHPDRLRYPMKRVGARGESRWERITWVDALNEVTNKMLRIKEESGPESVAFYRGTQGWWYYTYTDFYRLGRLFGTPNTCGVDFMCHWPKEVGSALVYGDMIVPDYANTRCLVIWGANPFYAGAYPPNTSPVILNAMRRGVKIIVVDPRCTFLSSRADLWLQVRPGSDGALALAMLNIIIEEKLYDSHFVQDWTIGFEELKNLAARYSAEEAAKITGVPADKIVEAARMYATNRPSSILMYNGVDDHTNSIQMIRSICSLVAVTGNIDVKGGNIFRSSPVPMQQFFGELEDKAREKRLIGGLPLWKGNLPGDQGYSPALFDAILTGRPYKIRALLVLGANPMATMPNTKKVAEALGKVEFLAVSEIFNTPTTELADIVLPCCTSYERYGIETYKVKETALVALRRPVIQPKWESRPDYEIAFEMAKKLGYGEAFWNGDIKKALNAALASSGTSVEELEKHPEGVYLPAKSMVEKRYQTVDETTGQPKGFDTPSGKVEFRSRILEEIGQNPLPSYVEPAESSTTSQVSEQYPLILTTGARLPTYVHSWQRNIPWLREIFPDAQVDIHPRTAKEMGIIDGERVHVDSPRGSITVRARFTPTVSPKCVSITHGWASSSNANILIDYTQRDPIFGSPGLRSTLCRIRKANQPILQRCFKKEVAKVGIE